MEIDDSYYNRQRYVLGDDAMKLLSQSSIYLYGLKGLGVEIAKNLVLGGVKELYLDDSNICHVEDIGSQFYITEKNVKDNLNRARASVQKLSQLNPFVKVCVSPFSLDDLIEPMKNESNKAILEKLEKFSCIVLTNCDLIQIGIVNNFCRGMDIKMIVADVIGLFGIVFCDFGENFFIHSESDEENVEFFIGYISNDKSPILKVLNDDSHGLKTGDIVTFKDIDGMTELNGIECEIIVESRSVIKLKVDSTNMSTYTKNGICMQMKTKKTLHFSNFFEQCYEPTIINPDFCKLEYSRCLQLLYLGLRNFHFKHSRFPQENLESDFLELQKHLNKLNANFDELNANSWALIRKLCNSSSGELQPLSAFFGGIAAQEAIKAVTRRFTPIQQWFVMECVCLAPNKPDLNPVITRFDNLRKCIGQDLLEALQSLRIFMVGCGAIGCELLKNLAMLGVSTDEHKQITQLTNQFNNCGNFQCREESGGDAMSSSTPDADDDMSHSIPTDPPSNVILQSDQKTSKDSNHLSQLELKVANKIKCVSTSFCTSDESSKLLALSNNAKTGKIIITDNDLIEKSNLNRQFLFKEHHIKQSKSVIARQSVLEINPHLNIEAHQNFVSTDTENIYSDNFLQQIDVCLNALDNIDSRKYMDNRCVINEKCLIESGTMSTKGHVQVIIPHMTENYSSQGDPQEKQIPYCTLKSFPAKIEHCIEWAREKFESEFFLKPSIAKTYLDTIDKRSLKMNPEYSASCEDLIKTVKFLRKKPCSYNACIQMARLKFEVLFNHKACQLLHSFPLHTKLEDGTLFWQLPRRPPTSILFDINDPLHFQFISTYAQLLGSLYGNNPDKNHIDFFVYQQCIENYKLPIFIPSDKSIETDESVNREDKKLNNMKIEDLEIGESSLIDLLKYTDHDELACIKFIEFDKDNTLHIEFISSLSNLRSRMYGIEEVDTQTVKKISGRIIPAIATTTSVVAGLVIIELMKYAKKCQLSEHRNSFLNLSLSQFVLSEPGNCQYETVINSCGEKLSYSLWDHWNVIGNDSFTIRDLIKDLEIQKSLTLNMILQGNRIIYLNILPGSKNKLDLKLNPLLVTNDEDGYADLLVSYTNPAFVNKSDDNEDVKGPRVRYWLNKNHSINNL